MLGGGRTRLASGDLQAGLLCRGDNAACLFATAKMAVLKGKKKKKEKCFCTSSLCIF